MEKNNINIAANLDELLKTNDPYYFITNYPEKVWEALETLHDENKKFTENAAKKKKNIMMDIAFSIDTDKEFEDLTKDELLGALLKRISDLHIHWELDSIGFCDEYEH